MLCMAILLYIMAIWDQGLFYNVPYFRLGLTAFYGPPAVHLHVAGRQEHCIIMSFPAPKCYFTGRGSFLKLHHFYNSPNFYSRHYYQQDFITYLECKQVWVMTPPAPSRIHSRWWAPAAISDARVQTQKKTGQTSACARARAHKTATHPHATFTSQSCLAKMQLKGCNLQVCVRAHVCVADKKGEGGAGGCWCWRVEREIFILNSHKSCRRKMSKCAG